MRRVVLTCSLLGSLSFISCAPVGTPPVEEGPVGRSQDAIAYGAADNSHTAVVALLTPGPGGTFGECSGTIVQMKNDVAYVLTAAHCCNETAPSVLVRANDYTVGVQYLGGGNPLAPAFPVVPGSVYYHAQYNQVNYDFCMLKASGLPANTPVIPVPQPGQDGLALGVMVEHVGYGVTDNNQNNSVRRTGTNTVNQEVTPLHIAYSQGGAQKIPGPCQGDSGGPALMPAGAAQAQQQVVAVTSYGNSDNCAQGSLGVSMRVSSETGPGGFVANFLNDTPSGVQAGSGVITCNSCAQSAQNGNGACSAQAQACVNDAKCVALSNCLQGCQSQACVDACVNTAGQTATNKLIAVQNCICDTACVDPCVVECGGSGSSSSSGGMMGCGLQSSDPACDSCLTASCCNEAKACAADSSCTNCLSSANPPPACNNVATYVGLFGCLDDHCVGPCGGGSGSASSSASSASSSAGGTTSTASGGPGAGGAGGAGGSSGAGETGAGVTTGNTAAGTGTSSNGAGGGDISIGSGCSVSSSQQGTSASLAGLLFAAALAFTRRKRSA